MQIDVRNTNEKRGPILKLYSYLEKMEDLQLWYYMGLQVEIDPIVDFENQNILIRWSDINEGFNDRIIVNSLEEYKSLFSPINNA